MLISVILSEMEVFFQRYKDRFFQTWDHFLKSWKNVTKFWTDESHSSVSG